MKCEKGGECEIVAVGAEEGSVDHSLLTETQVVAPEFKCRKCGREYYRREVEADRGS